MFQVMSTTWVPIPLIFTSTFVSNPFWINNNDKMAPLSRFEVLGPEMVEEDLRDVDLFDKIGWGLFFKIFSCHHYENTM